MLRVNPARDEPGTTDVPFPRSAPRGASQRAHSPASTATRSPGDHLGEIGMGSAALLPHIPQSHPGFEEPGRCPRCTHPQPTAGTGPPGWSNEDKEVGERSRHRGSVPGEGRQTALLCWSGRAVTARSHARRRGEMIHAEQQ